MEISKFKVKYKYQCWDDFKSVIVNHDFNHFMRFFILILNHSFLMILISNHFVYDFDLI